MTVNRGPGVTPIAGVGTTTVEHRLQLAGLYAENAPGVPRSGVLAQAADQLVTGRADMSYDIGPAPLVISRTAGEGVYTPTLSGTTNVGTDPAPATNSRWDLIYIKQNDQTKGDADNQAVIGVQKGVAAASPVKPTADLPAGAYVLAEARIFATTTGTSGGSNTITQVWRHTAARGAQIKIRNATERAEITTPAKGQEILRTDLTQVSPVGVVERWNGTTWDHFGHAEYTYNTATNIPSGQVWGPGTLTIDSPKSTDPAFVTASIDTFTFRDAGISDLTFTANFNSTATARSWLEFWDGVNFYARTPVPVGEIGVSVSIPNYRHAAGGTIKMAAFFNTTANANTWGYSGRATVTRIG